MLAVEFLGSSAGPSSAVEGVLWCDGRRSTDLAPGARVEVRRGVKPVLLARLRGGLDGHGPAAPFTFTDRLVAKFGLPVSGWRGRQGRSAGGEDGKGAPPADA
jgi:NAD+ kinase